MIKIIGPRQTGKTTRLIKLSNATGQYILCPNLQQVDMIYRMAKNMELEIPKPIILSQLKGINGNKIKEEGLLIDNMDILVQQILRDIFGNTKIDFATFLDDKINL